MLAVDLGIIALQKGINYYIREESQTVNSQVNKELRRSINFVVKGANENLISPKYLNTEDLSRIINVVLSGANDDYSKEINALGVRIFNKYYTPDKPSRVQPTKSGLYFMQNMNKIIPERKK